MEAENEEEMEELSFIPSAVSEPRRALHICDIKCRAKGFKFFAIAGIVTEEAHTIKLCKTCYNVRRTKRGEEEVTASPWRELVKQKVFRGKLWPAFGMDHSCAECGKVSPSKTLGPDRSWQMQTGGNMSRRTRRSSSL